LVLTLMVAKLTHPAVGLVYIGPRVTAQACLLEPDCSKSHVADTVSDVSSAFPLSAVLCDGLSATTGCIGCDVSCVAICHIRPIRTGCTGCKGCKVWPPQQAAELMTCHTPWA
jgi:hypothetical protein